MSKKYFILILCVVAHTLFQCGGASEKKEKPKEEKEVGKPEITIRFMPTPPPDLDSNATPQQLAAFAWEEFLALNWQASYPKDGKRDSPDLTWSYQDKSPYPPLVVWETFAHRTELRPFTGQRRPFDSPPYYSFGDALQQGSSEGKPDGSAKFNLFHALDENNEIGSCDVYARIDKYQKQYQVLYQAKVNRDEYEYIRTKFLDDKALAAAATYNMNQLKNPPHTYSGKPNTNSCDCGADYKGISLPCGDRKTGRIGAMEVKTAWRQLTPDDDSTKFFRRTVITFRQGKDGKFYYDNKTYALIALHIIHKTRNYEDFVFATWEHVDVEASNMGLIELDNGGKETSATPSTYKRLHGISDVANQATSAAHAFLKNANPNSIWLNYRLVGVQGTPTNNTNTDSFFLANYVVESDSLLANFHGSGFGHPHDTLTNTYYRGNAISAGGCQGCHGVAQKTFGGDFSFLLDSGNGKPVQRPDVFNYGDTTSNKLQKYIRAMSKK